MATMRRLSLFVICFQFGILSQLSDIALAGRSTFSSASITRYKELLHDLFDHYDTRIRPRLNQSSTVEVNSSFTVTSIVEFDITGQSISVMGHFILIWFDELLSWDPNEYEHTNYITVTLKDIWYPQIEFEKVGVIC